jgi:hypothetical protein
MSYSIASTHRKPGPPAAAGWQPPWHPAGTAHAVLAKPRGGHHTVTMCGIAVRDLHLFEALQFLRVRLCPECRDCRDWVLADERRLVAAADAATGRAG